MNETLLLTLLFLPFFHAGLILLYPNSCRRIFGYLSATSSLLCLSIVIYLSSILSHGQKVMVSYEWFPLAFVKFSLFADGLALFFSLLICGMGVLVFYYANNYMGQEDPYLRNFYLYMNLFMGAMLGAVLSNNLILLFLFWELTGVMSYLLISYHFELPKARVSGRSAFLATSLGSLFMLIGVIFVGVLDQTLEITEIFQKGILYGEHSFWYVTVMVLMLIGAFAKSAQFPFHIWLPQAMTAPTPVSSYLHSATMVKLGIYLIARFFPLFAESSLWFPIVTTFSLITVLLGGFWALFANSLKKILAYATISQLGFFISFYGIGNPEGLRYDYIHIFNHALYKASLFMLVGILSHVSSITEIHELRKLHRKLPFMSLIFLVSIAAMAGVPGTTGFLSKELLLSDLLLFIKQDARSILVLGSLLLGLVLKVAFSFRLFYFLYLHEEKAHVTILEKPDWKLLLSPFLLSSIALLLGIWPKGLQALSQTYSIEGLHVGEIGELDIFHGFSLSLMISVLLFTCGVFLFWLTKRIEDFYDDVEPYRPAAHWYFILDRIPRLGAWITSRFHSSSPEIHLRWVLLTLITGIGGLLYLSSHPFLNLEQNQSLWILEILVSVAVILLFASSRSINRLIVLSLIGFLITYYFVLKNAPDVAITQMVVEVATLFAFVLFVFKLPNTQKSTFSFYRLILSVAGGLTIAATPFLNRSISVGDNLGYFFAENSQLLAKGTNVVNTILVDFRGLDTLGEIAVVIVAALSVSLLLANGKQSPRSKHSLIPTDMLALIMPFVLLASAFFSVFLLVRGHDYPGGGFAGGMSLAISFVLVKICYARKCLSFLNVEHSQKLALGGLFLSLLAGIFSLVQGEGYMSSYFLGGSTIVSTTFLFDLGIFFLVIGSVCSILFAMRNETVEEVDG